MNYDTVLPEKILRHYRHRRFHPIVSECARWLALAACIGYLAFIYLLTAGAIWSIASAVKEALNTEVVDE